jgi:hypothetical protein
MKALGQCGKIIELMPGKHGLDDLGDPVEHFYKLPVNHAGPHACACWYQWDEVNLPVTDPYNNLPNPKDRIT